MPLVVALAAVSVTCSDEEPSRDARPETSTTVSSTASTTSVTPAPAPATSTGHLRPWPVLFGWAVLVAEEDGGFVDVTPPKTAEEAVHDAFFLDRQHGWVGLTDSARAAGRLVRTVDGGRTWEDTHLAVARHHSAGSQVSIHFLDDRRGWVTDYAAAADGGGGLHHSDDGGRTWSELPRTPIPGTVRFTNADHGWLLGGRPPGVGPSLYETLDGGKSWHLRTVEPPPGSPSDRLIYYQPGVFDRDAVLAAGVSNDERERLGFYTSTDGGRTWRLAAQLDEGGFVHGFIAIVSPTVWWAVSEGGFTALVTVDSGRTWRRQTTEGLDGLLQWVEAKDERHAWAVTNAGGRTVVLATDDGGATWSPAEKAGAAGFAPG